MIRAGALALMTAVCAGAGTSVIAQEPAGEQAYRKVCQACHGPAGRGDEGPPLLPMTREAEEVLAIVREGVGQMPAISRKEVTDDEVRQIVDYLQSIRPDETPPPAR